LIVVPAFRLANATAPRKLQSFAAAVQPEAKASSSLRSTSIVISGGEAKLISAVFAATLSRGE
jgi:hypothetical protein